MHAAEQKEERNCHIKSHFHVAFTFIMKIVKLKENRDFRRIYNKGKSYVCPFFVIYVNPNRSKNVRLGITVGKKIGNAVKRNRAKRVITAAFRSAYPQIAAGNDFVIVARTRILNVKSTKVEELLLKLLKEHGTCDRVLIPKDRIKDKDENQIKKIVEDKYIELEYKRKVELAQRKESREKYGV